MPFSSLQDPVDVARAQAALDTAWELLRSDVASEDHESERTRLAYIIASFILVAADDEDLVARALARFKKTAG